MILFIIPWGRSVYSAYYNYKYILNLKTIIDNNIGVVCIDDVNINNKERYEWAWTFPCVSLLIRDDKHKAIISNSRSYKGWQPFNPYIKNSVPNLNKYSWLSP